MFSLNSLERNNNTFNFLCKYCPSAIRSTNLDSEILINFPFESRMKTSSARSENLMNISCRPKPTKGAVEVILMAHSGVKLPSALNIKSINE